MRYIDNQGKSTQQYPLNPNGSPLGITGLCSEDGRAMVMMPHPERVFRTVQNSRGTPIHGEKMRHGCACSAMRESGSARTV